MSGHVSGVQQCISQALNLVVVSGCSDTSLIRNNMATIENVAVFFSVYAVRKNMLQEQPQGSKETQACYKRKTGGTYVGHTLGLQRE